MTIEIGDFHIWIGDCAPSVAFLRRAGVLLVVFRIRRMKISVEE